MNELSTEERTRKLDEAFKFKIGGTVRLKVRIRSQKPHILCIVERTAQECPAGPQYHYTCRIHTEDGFGLKSESFNEVELEACDFSKEILDYKDYEEEKSEVEHEKFMAKMEKRRAKEAEKDE